MEDRTNHNALAEQFASRLREEAPAPVAAPAETPRKPRRPRVVEPTAPAPETVIAAADLPEWVVTPFAWPEDRPLQVIACEQNTVEWHHARLGIATASSFDAIMMPGKTKAEQKTRRTYMLKLAGEILTGYPAEFVVTKAMERGHLLEPEARDLYMLQTGERPDQVGFLRRGRVGCSPDSLIGANGGLEIKTKLPHLVLDLILKDEFPEEHKAQVQGALWLTGREWWDLDVVGAVEVDGIPTLAPNIPPFIKRAYRDETYINQLASEVDRFNDDLDAIVAQMRARMGNDFTEFAAAA